MRCLEDPTILKVTTKGSALSPSLAVYKQRRRHRQSTPEPRAMLPQRSDDDPPPAAEDEAACGCRSVTWVRALAFALFAFNCAVAVYDDSPSSHGRSVIVSSFLDLLAVIVSLDRYEKAEPGSELRGRLRVCVGLLTAALGFVSLRQVSVVAPLFGVVATRVYYM